MKNRSLFKFAENSAEREVTPGLESHYVTMSDGTKLAVTIMVPPESIKPLPVIFMYHPYKRLTIDPKTSQIDITFGPEVIKSFINNGYVFVCADMRGSGASYGSRVDMTPILGQDGKEIIDWIAAQPWCDGNVGMIGGSYHGWSQLATAGHKPRALKCIMPEMMGFDMYSDAWFPGGILNQEMMDKMKVTFPVLDTNYYSGKESNLPIETIIFPTLPVVDEDGDGQLQDEIPLDVNGKGTFLDDYPPKYADGKPRQHIYYQATKEHLKNLYLPTWADTVMYRDDIAAGTDTVAHTGPNDWPVRMAESGVAIYNIVGWFDIFTRGGFRWYCTLKAINPSKLLVTPLFHSSPDIVSYNQGPYLKYFGVERTGFAEWMTQERLRFFDRYLKGIKNGVDTEPPIRIFVMNGEGWRNEKEWPLARQVMTNYSFDARNNLTLGAPKSTGYDKYLVDFSHSSKSIGGTRWISHQAPDTVMKRTSLDYKCLTYNSTPIIKDTEITGHPIVTLWVSSTANDGDFFVYLEDVDEKGEAYYITEGMLRSGFAKQKANEDILLSGFGIDVLPNLPWHGFKKTDYVDGIFRNSKIIKLVFDLIPTSWVIKKGHCIRVSIACADWPIFRLHPKLSPNNNPSDQNNIVPTITVYRDAEHPSGIQLPVIP